jgi:hypothetical protein
MNEHLAINCQAFVPKTRRPVAEQAVDNRLRRSQIFIARDAKKGDQLRRSGISMRTASYAASNGAFRYIVVTIKILLLRSGSSLHSS